MVAEDDGRVVAVPLGEAIEMARTLHGIVASLDHLSSRVSSGDADAETFQELMRDWVITPRLAGVRGVLWQALSEVIGEQAVDELLEEVVPAFPGPVPEEVRRLRQNLEAEARDWYGDIS